MSVTLNDASSAPTFTPAGVEAILTHAKKEITKEMAKALTEGLQQKISFKELAEVHTFANIQERLGALDVKAQMVFQKLFMLTLTHVKVISADVLIPTFAQIDKDKGPQSSGMFLASFVLRALNPMIEKLQQEQPGAIDAPELWH